MTRVRHEKRQARPGFGYVVKAEPSLSRHQALTALSGTSLLYAMRVPGGFIKLGVSSNLAMRVRQLHGDILAVRPGDRDDEREMHRRLAGHAEFGREYYPPNDVVLAEVNDMRSDLGLPPIAA